MQSFVGAVLEHCKKYGLIIFEETNKQATQVWQYELSRVGQ